MPKQSTTQTTHKPTKSRSLLAAIGPGIIWASTSIGVSHVVQSTRAGADFGYQLVALIILANLIKYPFFQMGPRYAAGTGESLLDGYKRLGNGAFGFFLILTFATMFIIQAAVTIVAAGLAANLISTSLSVSHWSAIILISIMLILLIGRYSLLDKILKIMMMIFAVVTVIAVVTALFADSSDNPQQIIDVSLTSAASIAFMVALVGWMPTSIELSVWHSLWTLSRQKQTQHKPRVKEALFDFNFGFLFCMIFALLFLVLGATLAYASGQSLSGSAIGFTGQLIDLFVNSLGSWSWPIIALVTFIAMYSTCLAVSAGFSDVCTRAAKIILPEKHTIVSKVYYATLFSLVIGGWLIIDYFGSGLKQLIDFATTVSFVSAPAFAFLNLKVMQLSHVPDEAKLTKGMYLYSWFCFFVLAGFSGFFLYWRFWL